MTLLICAQGECGICPLYYFVSLRIPQYKHHYHVTCIDNAKFSSGYFHFKIIRTELLDLTKLHLRLNSGQLPIAAHLLWCSILGFSVRNLFIYLSFTHISFRQSVWLAPSLLKNWEWWQRGVVERWVWWRNRVIINFWCSEWWLRSRREGVGLQIRLSRFCICHRGQFYAGGHFFVILEFALLCIVMFLQGIRW